MEIIYSPNTESPFKEIRKANRAGGWASTDVCGAFSVEQFCNASPLTYTHEDAQGWLNYLMRFHDANFWMKDGNVQPWAYYEDYDNWQDTYGMDAVLAAYHSGHGGMDANGVFYAAMGADWGGLGCSARSDQMRLGNEQVRYVFWSTCDSLKIRDGHSPIRTWGSANLGFRMLFGFDTVSVDDPNYGKFFWEEWNKNKSFSTAWMDASWRISQNQAPSVVACGATPEEARDRVYNERSLFWEPVSTAYWHWRWYYNRSGRELNRELPEALLVAQLVPVAMSEQAVQSILGQYNLDVRLPDRITATPSGAFSLSGEGNTRLSVSSNGAYEVRMATANLDNRLPLSTQQVRSIAEDSISSYGLDRESGLIFDSIRQEYAAGGSLEQDSHDEMPAIVETTVQYRQVINGLPVLSSEAGTVRVSVDNDGTVTRVHSGIRAIDRLSDRPKNAIMPPQNGSPVRPRSISSRGYEQLLNQEWQKRVAALAVRGGVPTQVETVPGTTEIGYQIRGNEAVLVAQRLVEADFGNGYRKRYYITVPIVE